MEKDSSKSHPTSKGSNTGGKNDKRHTKKKRSKKKRNDPKKQENQQSEQNGSGEARSNFQEEIHYTTSESEESDVENTIDKKRAHALGLLRPLCVALMQKRTPQNVKAIVKVLPSVDEEILKEIQIYITFPIHTSLHYKHMTESLLIGLCRALQAIFQKTEVQSVQTFFDVLNPLLFFFAPPNSTDYQCMKSEEAKIAVLETMQLLFHKPCKLVLRQVYQLQHMPVHGQLVSSLLSMAEFERSRQIQVEALACLRQILLEGGQSPAYLESGDLRQVSALFAFIVPGVCVSLTRILTGDEKQGHTVFSSALLGLCKVIVLSLSDFAVENTDYTLPLPPEIEGDRRKQLLSLMTKRDDEWVKNTAAKFKMVLERVCKAILTHSHVETRVTLLTVLDKLMKNCTKSLKECLPLFLETMISLMQDPNPKVSRLAEDMLRHHKFGDGYLRDMPGLTELLQENLYQLTTSLPRHIRMADEEDKLRTIRLLNGYISVLGSNIDCILLSPNHLHRLALALVQSLELDVSEIKIVEERGSLIHQDKDLMKNADSVNLWRPRKYFKHFRSEEVWQELAKVCRQLGKYGSLFVLVDHLMELYHESALYRLASALVINEVIYGARDPTPTVSCLGDVPSQEKTVDQLQDVISMVLEEYVKDGNLQLPDLYDDSKKLAPLPPPQPNPFASSLMVVKRQTASLGEKKSLANRNRAVLLVCIFMEGIAKFTAVLGWDFEVHFIKALYPLVENLGHENIYISHTAYYALAKICDAWVYKTLDNLLQQNADYLMNSVGLRLRHFQSHPRCPQTICVMLRYCYKELLPLIKHNIAQLMDTLDDNYVEHLVLFLPVLLELASAIGRWFPSPPKSGPGSQEPSEAAQSDDQDLQDIGSFIQDYVKQKTLTETFEDTEENGGSSQEERTLREIQEDMDHILEEKRKEEEEKEKEEEMEEVEEEESSGKKDKCPLHIQMVKDIIQRVKHFLSSHDGRLRVQAVDILCQSCIDLQGTEGELLPALHQTWPGFCPLFRSEDKFIVIKAMKALVSISALSQDFLQQRVLKDVMPGLLTYLDTQGKISSGSRPAYLHTAHFKLQLCILTHLGTVVKNLQIEGSHLDQIATTCLPYLSSTQPQQLQKASKEAFSSFITISADAIWLMLMQRCSAWDLTPPGPEFMPVKFPCSTSTACSASAINVSELIQLHFS